ncbi:MAG: hypothetical protein ACHQT8_07145, partial [Chlamydiales bacterium]
MSTSLKLRGHEQTLTLTDFYNFVERNTPNSEDILIVDHPEMRSRLARSHAHEIRAEQAKSFLSRLFSLSLFASEDEQNANRATWRVFLRVMGEEEGADGFVVNSRLERIARRYKIDFRALAPTGRPLTVENIEQYAVSSAKVFIGEVQSLTHTDPYRLSKDALNQYVRSIQNTRLINRGAQPERVHGGPDTYGDLFWHRPLHLDRKRVRLSLTTEHLTLPVEIARQYPYLVSDLPWVDRMAKVFSSMEMEMGELIPVPSHGGVDQYVVFNKIGTGDGLVAYALKSVAQNSDLLPLLIFRPSQSAVFAAEDAVETLFNDMEANIGETGYN